jgi:chloride channel protein, CIC family
VDSRLPQPLQRLLQPKQIAIFEACLIGFISALAAVLLKHGVEILGDWRLRVAHSYPVWLLFPLIGLGGGWLSGLLIARLAPEAAGSGIPQVKAVLAYVPIDLNARVAIVKLISTLLSLGAGLTLGRQGPTVQIGAAIAAQLSRWVPTSPDHRRQLIAAGAAAGLAAGFNAPIAGVLFVVEELLHDVSGLTLGTAILASFVGGVVSRLLGGETIDLGLKLVEADTHFSALAIPVFMLIGILAGLLGALFCRGALVSLSLNRRLGLGLPGRVGLAGLLSGVIVVLLPTTLQDNASLQAVWVTSELSWQLVALVFVSKFILTLIACGSGAPGGLFAPSLILGSALGYLVSYTAQWLQMVLPLPWAIQTGTGFSITCALVGMGAFFSAVTRGPITAIVIVFEMTTDFNLVLPLMIGAVVAYLVGESLFSGSIYHHILAWNGMKLSQFTAIDQRLSGLTAATIMQHRVETLSSTMSLDELKQAFSRSHHRGFPIVDAGRLMGIVTQTDLVKISVQQLPGDLPLSKIMTPRPITVEATAPLSQVLHLLNHHKISRLPVTEGRKLVGIITRADIIRAESDKLTHTTGEAGPKPEPSYVVYQTRAPATGQGRLLVPIANPKTAANLLQLAAAIARDRNYELECLQVIPIARHHSPSETTVSTAISRRLLKHATRLGQTWQIPVHTQVRVTHDIAHAILETLKERHIDLVLMGWKGTTDTPGRIFGSVVDTIIRQASCDVVLVKFGAGHTGTHQTGDYHDATNPPSHQATDRPVDRLDPASDLARHRFDRWLIPTAGGPNSRRAMRLMPGLVALSQRAEIQLCQVCAPDTDLPNLTPLEEARAYLNRHLSVSVTVVSVCARSVADAVIDLAQKDQCDVIVLGATREGLLQQVIQGNIPEEIARRCSCTVILVRGAID